VLTASGVTEGTSLGVKIIVTFVAWLVFRRAAWYGGIEKESIWKRVWKKLPARGEKVGQSWKSKDTAVHRGRVCGREGSMPGQVDGSAARADQAGPASRRPDFAPAAGEEERGDEESIATRLPNHAFSGLLNRSQGTSDVEQGLSDDLD
jgi:hypothetical protein